MSQVHLPQHFKEQIESHGEATYPHECCGILFGSVEGENKFISEIQSIENANDTSPQNRYLIPPQEIFKAERYARENHLEILGYYHSHPDVAAEPSEFDREHAWPWYAYFIISVKQGKAAEIKSWELKADRSKFIQRDLHMTQGQDLTPTGGH